MTVVINRFKKYFVRFVFNILFLIYFRVLYFSIHRYEYGKYWPWLRESDYDYIGEGEGIGYNINVPLNQVSLPRST